MKNFNDYNRDIQRHVEDHRVAYYLTHLFEIIIEMQKQLDLTAQIVERFATQLQTIVHVSDALQGDVRKIQRKVDGVEVESVLDTPED